jgi:integrase
MTRRQLSAAEVAQLRRRPGRHRVSSALYLNVRPSGAASWLFRFMWHGKAKWMGLGPLDLVSLADARARVLVERKLLKVDHVDPLEARREKITAARIAAARAITFGECARRYLEAHAKQWTHPRYAKQWRRTFFHPRQPAATALINDLPVNAIDTGLAIKTLEAIWRRTPATASRVRQRCEAVISYAIVSGFREGPNPFVWKGHLNRVLPSPADKTRKHLAALDYRDVPMLMAGLRERNGLAARALELTILTAVRTGETRFATWDEIDLADAIWVIPAERTKTGREHRVPLAPRAVKLLRALPRLANNKHVFPGELDNDRPFGQAKMLLLLQELRPKTTVHGFRSSFRDWAAECTAYPHEVCELALGHRQPSAVVRAYQRSDLFDRRRRLMADWAAYCGGAAITGEVVPLRGVS